MSGKCSEADDWNLRSACPPGALVPQGHPHHPSPGARGTRGAASEARIAAPGEPPGGQGPNLR